MTQPRSIRGTRYGAQEAKGPSEREHLDRRNKAYVALRIPAALLDRIKSKMHATGMTKQYVCIEAIERGLER